MSSKKNYFSYVLPFLNKQCTKWKAIKIKMRKFLFWKNKITQYWYEPIKNQNYYLIKNFKKTVYKIKFLFFSLKHFIRQAKKFRKGNKKQNWLWYFKFWNTELKENYGLSQQRRKNPFKILNFYFSKYLEKKTSITNNFPINKKYVINNELRNFFKWKKKKYITLMRSFFKYLKIIKFSLKYFNLLFSKKFSFFFKKRINKLINFNLNIKKLFIFFIKNPLEKKLRNFICYLITNKNIKIDKKTFKALKKKLSLVVSIIKKQSTKNIACPIHGQNLNKRAFYAWIKRTKNIKKRYKLIKHRETRRLKRMAFFFRIFGFRKNRNRKERSLRNTKKFKRYALYKKIISLLAHKNVSDNDIYPIQPMRSFLSYYKMRWQGLKYFIKNFFTKSLTRTQLIKFVKKSNKKKKGKFITYISTLEYSLSSLLLRLRLVSTSGTALHLIKHGYVFVNYKKIKYPDYIVKIHDTISIYINSLIYSTHRFNDPLYTFRLAPGLYRRNTGRQSPISNENQSTNFVTSCLNEVQKWKVTNIFNFRKNACVPTFSPQARFQYEKRRWLEFTRYKAAGWKHGIVAEKINNFFLNNNPALVTSLGLQI